MPTSVAANCTAVSGWATMSTPTATSARARATRRHFDSGSVVAILQTPSSFPSTATGRTSDAAAAATTAPVPTRTQPKVRRSPRKAAHTALAAARSSGSWKPSSTKARAMA